MGSNHSNAGGLEIYRRGEWEEWENDDGENIDEVADRQREEAKA